MGSIGSTTNPQNISITNAVVTPIIYNVVCINSNTEYSQTLPSNSKGFIIKARELDVDLKVYFSTGASNYITVHGGYAYNNDKVYASVTLFFQSPTAGTVVEILVES